MLKYVWGILKSTFRRDDSHCAMHTCSTVCHPRVAITELYSALRSANACLHMWVSCSARSVIALSAIGVIYTFNVRFSSDRNLNSWSCSEPHLCIMYLGEANFKIGSLKFQPTYKFNEINNNFETMLAIKFRALNCMSPIKGVVVWFCCVS